MRLLALLVLSFVFQAVSIASPLTGTYYREGDKAQEFVIDQRGLITKSGFEIPLTDKTLVRFVHPIRQRMETYREIDPTTGLCVKKTRPVPGEFETRGYFKMRVMVRKPVGPGSVTEWKTCGYSANFVFRLFDTGDGFDVVVRHADQFFGNADGTCNSGGRVETGTYFLKTPN